MESINAAMEDLNPLPNASIWQVKSRGYANQAKIGKANIASKEWALFQGGVPCCNCSATTLKDLCNGLQHAHKLNRTRTAEDLKEGVGRGTTAQKDI